MTKMEDEVTPEALRPSRPPEPVMSPPLPPPTFNPPAESPPDPSVSISPPPSLDASTTTNASSPGSAPLMAAFDHPPASPASSIPRRPDLRAVQRLSDDVILSSPGTGSQGSVSSSPVGSEGGEHLQEMRERLLSESSSAGSSRRESESSTPSATPRASLDIQVTAPTPPTAPEQSRESPEAGPSRLVSSPLSSQSSTLDTTVEHKWDSVWPATVQPRPLASDDKLPPFSPAPVSPFVTPTFSAPAPLVTRKTVSPTLPPGSPTFGGRSTSPVRFSPRSMAAGVDAQQPANMLGRSPPLPTPSPSRHSRTQSSGSTLSRPSIENRPLSPPTSPMSGDMLASSSQQRINDSLSRRADPQSPKSRARAGSSSAGSGSRPRRTSFNDAPQQSFRLSPDARVKMSPPTRAAIKEDDIPPLPPTDSSFGLPPAVASPPVTLSGDDGSISAEQLFSPPLVAPLARPAALRRALSDYDAQQRPNPTQFHRTLSLAAELDQSPKRPEAICTADTISAADPLSPTDPSPRSPTLEGAAIAQPEATTHPPENLDKPQPDHVGDLNLVDEGDILPTGDYQMDVTFDDEGLNTLERIFLLSQSDFGFHRAYVARVLGDLLEEVDPCESVEYVLPLLNGYSVDEDETVKEAFSSELHRILWYFFSTCRLTTEPGETMTVTSEGIEYVPKPTLEEMPEIPAINMDRRSSIISTGGPSSAGSSLTNPKSSLFEQSDTDTPNSVTSVNSDQTAFSPVPWVDAAIDVDSAKESAQLVTQPELAINTFTPLLGNLMLSPNPVVGDHTRDAIIAVIGRLRGNADPEKWVRASGDQDTRKTFPSQNGLHAHDLRPFSSDAKVMVETELVNGIVLGMGRLSTDLPEQYFEDDENRALSEDGEAFKLQLVQEAEAGRAISLYLIGSLCDVYAGQEVVDKGFSDEVLRSIDGDETTRTEGAVALSRMAKTVPVEHIVPMLPVFNTFATDESESVRQAVATALPALAKRIESLESRRTFAVDGIEALMRDGVNCRCSALEVLGELIYLFNDDPSGPPQQLLDIYWDDSQSGASSAIDRVWDIIATFNFPGVCLTLGAERWPEMRDLFHRLQGRATDKVLTTIASFLHELTKILKPEQVAEDLLPVYTRLIDAKEDIRERVFEHVDVFIAGLPAELGWMTFLGLAEAWKCDTLGGWRSREAVALHIPAFLELFVARDIDISPILQMTSSALLDKFAAVRDAAIKGIPQSYMTLNGTQFAAPFRDMLLDLSTASAFRQRVTFTRCLREFVKPPPHREPFEEFFAPALPRLRTDVVDVRIALAQIVADLFVVGAYYSTDTQIPPVITQLAQALADDDAVDVRDAVRNINLDRLHKGKEVRRGSPDIDGPQAPDRQLSTTGDDSSNAQDDGRPEIQRRPSAEVSGKMSGLTVSRNSDPEVTPRFNGHGREPSGTSAVDPFATSFNKAVNEAGHDGDVFAPDTPSPSER